MPVSAPYCELLGMGIISWVLLDFSALRILFACGRWPNGNCLVDVVRTLGLKPRMPLSTGATFDNLSKLAFSSEKEEYMVNA